ncbi:MAG: (Fe-S)-binding protein [Deltaproteobacteria bacterium]|nr:(Fe-S)-binding protein [Deltaproteobacteria bacterium]
MSPLPDHRRAVAYCSTCQKLCAFTCPVSGATGHEAHTPTSKVDAVHQHLTGARSLDEHAAAAIYACAGCGRCTAHCRHESPVGAVLFEARVEAVEEGEAPRSIDRLRAQFALAGNPHGADLAACARAVSRETEGRAFFPGCTALAREPSMARAAIDAAAGFGVRLALAAACRRCCGYPLWAAGLRPEFIEHARAFAREVDGLGELVVSDPGCAVAMTRAYREVGVELRPKVVLLVDLLADRLEYAFGRAPLPWNVVWHDACQLGRVLGRYEGPRRLLRAAVGDFAEAPEHREDGGCSGGGGLLPLTMPEASREIARRQAIALDAPGRRVVTGCPSACRSFRRAGVDALDLFTVLARWVAARDEDDGTG